MSNVRNRRLVIALIATSISVVVFSWLFRRSRLYVNAAHGKRANAIQTAWLWLRSFWIGGTEGGNGGGSTRTHQINPSEPNMAVLPSSSTEDHAESSNSTETSIANLAKRRISGSPRVVVLSTRRVRLHLFSYLDLLYDASFRPPSHSMLAAVLCLGAVQRRRRRFPPILAWRP